MESVTLNGKGRVHPAANDRQIQVAMLPSPCPQNHAANLLALPDGDLLCCWFAGTQEGIADIAIWCSRLEKGSACWSQPQKLSQDNSRSEQNPLLFLTPDRVLWLMYTAQIAGNQNTAIVRYRQSMDFGKSWGPIATLFDTPGTFIRQPVVVTPNGNWLLPVFYCTTRSGEKWVGNNDFSAVKISADQGETWRDRVVPDSTGCVHMNITLLKDGSLLALYRSRWADNIYLSRSYDNGESWSVPQPTELPNNNSSIQLTSLANGDLALVYNDISAEGARERRLSLYDEIEEQEEIRAARLLLPTGKSAFWGAPRAPMTLAISKDGGNSWPWKRNLDEGDGYCMSNNSQQKLNRELSYPSIKQGVHGELHIAYTWFRQAIKYVRVHPDWVMRCKGQWCW